MYQPLPYPIASGHRRRIKRLLNKHGNAAYHAAVYLLTASEELFLRTANCFCGNRLRFDHAELRGISLRDYTLFSAARDIDSDLDSISLSDLAHLEVVDNTAFRHIFNALFIARYSETQCKNRSEDTVCTM